MKKIIKSFIFIMIVCSICFGFKVKAENFYEGEYIDNMWITRDRSPAHWYQKARFFRQKSNNKEAYCLDPFALFDENSYYSSSTSYSNLSQSVLNKVKLAAYYGYRYSGHTDQKWYAITQVLIWRYASSGNFFFTDGLDGPEISTYNRELQELDNMVSKHYVTPNFGNTVFKVPLGKEVVLTDSNNVLNDYQAATGFHVISDQNKLRFTPDKIGEYTMKFYRFLPQVSELPIFYSSSTSQDMMTRGKVDTVESSIKIIVEGGTITIHKLDDDNNSCNPQGEASLDGAVYEVYDTSNNLVDTVTISNCTAKTKELPYGNYTVKEKKPGEGYLKDDKSYAVTLDEDNKDIDLNLTNKVIKRKIEITKLYGSSSLEDYKVEPHIIFGVYDKNNNEVMKGETNRSGEIVFDLPYGNYVVKQLTSTKNYQKVEDIYISINEASDKKIKYVLKNNLLSTKLKVIKLDTSTNKPIVGKNAKFRIKSLSTGKYITHEVNGEETDLFEINEEGYFITDVMLEYGDYEIEEIVFPAGYKKVNKRIRFTLSEDSVHYDDELQEIIYELKLYNEKEDIVIDVPDTLEHSIVSSNLSLLIYGVYEEKKKYSCI